MTNQINQFIHSFVTISNFLHDKTLPESNSAKNILYLQFGQLSQLLGSVKDELSALKETEKTGSNRKSQKKGKERGALLLSWQHRAALNGLVTQRTVTFLTHTFMNNHSNPLYRCQGTFFLQVLLSHLSVYFSFQNIILCCTNPNTHKHTVRHFSTKRGKSISAHSEGKKGRHSCTHEHTRKLQLCTHTVVDALICWKSPNALLLYVPLTVFSNLLKCQTWNMKFLINLIFLSTSSQ